MSRQLLLLFLVLCFELAACVAPPLQLVEPSEVPEQPAQAPTAVAAAESRVVRIGVLNPTTGDLAVFGEWSNTGTELFFNSVDYRVGDTPVELVFADTAGDPQQALEQARRLVDQEHVDLLMGTVNSTVAVPVAQYADDAEVPLLLTIGGARAVTGEDRSPFVFRTSMANGQQDRPLGWYTASELGLQHAAIFAWDFLVGTERANGFSSTFTDAGGAIVTEQRPPLGTTDYGPFISHINPDDVDVVYAFFAGPGAISFLQQMQQGGLAPDLQVVASGFFTADVLQEMGETAMGVVEAAEYTPELDNPANQAFLELYSAEVGGEPGVYVEEGFLGALAAAAAIETVDADLGDTQRFLDALAELELETPSGPFRFGESGQSVRNVYITRVVEAGDGTVTHEVIDVIEDVSQDWRP